MALTYQTASTKYSRNEVFNAYITATANDTTDPVSGKVVDNRDGSIRNLSAMVSVTASAGSSPTLKLILEGSNDGSNWAVLKDSSNANIETSALDISGAASTAVVSLIESELKNRSKFPVFLRLKVDLGGSTPGWTGNVSLQVYRG